MEQKKPLVHSGEEVAGGKAERFSRSGFILAAIGSSVGLGNMWKFPYITGLYGGAAFFLLFVICLLVIGIPVLMAEMTIGRAGRGSPAVSLVRLSGKKIWGGFGLLSILGAFFIMSFYAVVAGWTLHYAVLTFGGGLGKGTDFEGAFFDFIGGFQPLVWQFIVMTVTGWIVIRGASGIEKFNKVLIPALVVILLFLMVRVLMLDGAGAGVEFFLKPDFSKLTNESVLVALGHAFFSLSLGMGTMLTYGAYVDRQQSLGAASLAVGGGDLLYALLAGLIIFPTTFAFGIEPGQGPGLAFIALPAAFSAMPAGWLFGGLFFILLAIAALTSCVSLLEVPVAYSMDRWNWGRPKATIVTTVLCFLVGIPSAISVGGAVGGLHWGLRSFFDWTDFIASNIILPLGGLIVTIFVGYVWREAGKEAGLTAGWFTIWLFILRYIAPVLIVLVFLHTSGILKF
ncbi:sodium-dependent transporter [Paenibacillus xylaniclasticus]|uniref:sodium-dependent transporter n=1 Tax=Paenibacillus xylaniclasticus TaxID=588083 RepID=UPI000FD7DB23|nr:MULTISPECIES: sodium-dependent transporter [Paenibacillus]GFN32806.1 transporter [Paenibacillus curdlanolyticus]